MKKVCYTEFLCANTVSDSIVKAFTGISIFVQKWFVWDVYYVKIWPETDQPRSKMPISNPYSLVAPRP